jgi:uncharacterized protein (TIGR02231 family)
MRVFTLLLVPFITAVSFPAFADEILASNRIASVTIYSQGAMLSREVTFEASAGAHQLLLTDLPGDTYAEALRLAGKDGVKAGAIWLRDDRLFPRAEALTPEQLAAKAQLKTAQAEVDQAADAIATVRAQIEAADAEVGFWSGSRPDWAGATAENLKSLSVVVAEGVAAARGKAIKAEAEARPLQDVLDGKVKARDRAQTAYDALPTRDGDYAALSIAVEVLVAGEHRLILTQFIDNAGWSPVYDLTLRREGGPNLILGRGALISQFTGEDWTGVDLTLSTSHPGSQAEASVLYPDYREIFDPEEEATQLPKLRSGAGVADTMAIAQAEPMVMAAAEIQGDVLVYHYPTKANIASGVENLRLSLDELSFVPKVQARAVPRADLVAYVTAKFVNTSGEVLLPGSVFLYRDTNLVGGATLPRLAAGDEWTQGFGAIDGLVLERRMPERSVGDRGLFSSETEQSERAMLTVRNLTDEIWPLRLLDQVPYSEQEELEATFKADPMPTETDVDGQRGILAWDFDLAPGAEQSVALEYALRWPSGMSLR